MLPDRFARTTILFLLTFSPKLLALPVTDLWVQSACKLERAGETRNFPGAMCIFGADGSLISVSMTKARKLSPEGKILWEVEGKFHHQANPSPDGKRLLLLAQDATLEARGKRRDDYFLVLNQAGKTLHKINAQEIVTQVKTPRYPVKIRKDHTGLAPDFEATHFNSIYEIPENSLSEKLPWLAPGNIIVNSLKLGIFILTPDLKKVLRHIDLSRFSHDNAIHDAQVNSRGELLVFNNNVKDSGLGPYSAIQKFDLRTLRPVFEFTPANKLLFYSAGGGGVQEIGEYIFFSHTLTGGFLYSKREKKIIRAYPGANGDPTGIRRIQEMKLIDASGFLSKAK